MFNCDSIADLQSFVIYLCTKKLFFFLDSCHCVFERKMALHFTDNKSNASASAAIKTPFLIEDILDRNSMKVANKIHFKNHADSQSARNITSTEHPANIDKNLRSNSEIQSNDEEYRKLLQSDRYDAFLILFPKKRHRRCCTLFSDEIMKKKSL